MIRRPEQAGCAEELPSLPTGTCSFSAASIRSRRCWTSSGAAGPPQALPRAGAAGCCPVRIGRGCESRLRASAAALDEGHRTGGPPMLALVPFASPASVAAFSSALAARAWRRRLPTLAARASVVTQRQCVPAQAGSAGSPLAAEPAAPE